MAAFSIRIYTSIETPRLFDGRLRSEIVLLGDPPSKIYSDVDILSVKTHLSVGTSTRNHAEWKTRDCAVDEG